jgi:TolB protein
MNKTFCIFLVVVAISFTNFNAQVMGSKIGIFETLSNIDSPLIPGNASYSEPAQTYRLSGSGINIWGTKDNVPFLWKKMNGDFIMQTRIRYITQGPEHHRKVGIMFRNSLVPNSTMVACASHGDGLASIQYRSKLGDSVRELQFEVKFPDVLQLEKKGNTYTMSVAKFGEVYETKKIENINIGDELLAGLFVCAHTSKFSEVAEFSNTLVFNTVPDTLVQYESYIGSLLEVMDVYTGKREVLADNVGSWQAPNWTPDGKTLIYNSNGLLYNFNISSKVSTILNTDFANKNNNDHVLTFDGTQIGISHHLSEAKGQSVVFTLPVTSYLHGWSPDNQFLLYTGKRGDNFGIYKISKDGGKEIPLIESKYLVNGPEYSPDGRYIYFCSTKNGFMQIWRMDSDGKNHVQLTFDELNDWFPHVSPDNKWLVFVSFPKNVPADKHPFYERVYLRLMPVDGGVVKSIGYLYGGQGTINVPSWSPDSKKIAFVSNGVFKQ